MSEHSIANIGFLLERSLINMRASLTEALHNAGVELTFSEYEVMRVLYKNGNQSQMRIAEFLHKDKATIKRTIDLLCSKEYIQRSTFNGRQNEITLTQRAIADKDKIIGIATAKLKSLFQDLSDNQIDLLIQTLTQLSVSPG